MPLSWQTPPRQRSWLVHSVPASPHVVPSGRWFGEQFPAPSQESKESQAPVVRFPQVLPAGAKVDVHGLPVAVGMQTSIVHSFPSSQTTGTPPLHVPSLQTSPVVQALPSSHGLVL